MTAPLTYKQALHHAGRRYWVKLLIICQGNVTRAAKIGGVTRTSLYVTLQQLGVVLPPKPRKSLSSSRRVGTALYGTRATVITERLANGAE
jgi:hypothetical protein